MVEDHPVAVEEKEEEVEAEVVHHHLVHPVAIHLAVAVVEVAVAEAVVDVKMNYVVKWICWLKMLVNIPKDVISRRSLIPIQ